MARYPATHRLSRPLSLKRLGEIETDLRHKVLSSRSRQALDREHREIVEHVKALDAASGGAQ